eukprot:6173267-Amphidinium_carterae.3
MSQANGSARAIVSFVHRRAGKYHNSMRAKDADQSINGRLSIDTTNSPGKGESKDRVFQNVFQKGHGILQVSVPTFQFTSSSKRWTEWTGSDCIPSHTILDCTHPRHPKAHYRQTLSEERRKHDLRWQMQDRINDVSSTHHGQLAANTRMPGLRNNEPH